MDSSERMLRLTMSSTPLGGFSFTGESIGPLLPLSRLWILAEQKRKKMEKKGKREREREEEEEIKK